MTALTGLRHTWTAALLWAKVERRARTARTDGAHVTTMPALTILDAYTNTTTQDGRVALAYRPTDPLAVTLVLSAENTTTHLVLARDLFAAALTQGQAGDAPLRVLHHPERGRITITYTRHTTTGTRITLIALPARQVRRAVRAWYKTIPLGAEHVDVAAAFTDYLTAQATR